MSVTLAGIVIEVSPLLEKKKAILETEVTPAGISAVPLQLECPVTALSKMVNEPEVLQSTVPLVLSYVPAAWARARGKPLETTAIKTATLKDLSQANLPFERISSLFGDETSDLENFMSSPCQVSTNSFSPDHNNDHSHMVIDHC